MLMIGLDIGGTKCAVVAADEKRGILDRVQIDTAHAPAWRDMLDRLAAAARTLADGRPIDAVGVSCGGPLDAARGLVLSPPNLPGWDGVPVTSTLNQLLDAPVYLQNDADACALAEWRFGAGRGANNLIFLTFGTGLGAGLILNGRLYSGANNMAGEAGHIRLADEGPVGYGKQGSFEGFCSGGGLRQLARLRLGETLTAKDLAQRADAGDEGAIKVLAESGTRLGQGLALLVDLLNPERIVIGSVYARARRHLEPAMLETLRREALPQSLAACQVLPARLGDRLGDVAAITVAFEGWCASKGIERNPASLGRPGKEDTGCNRTS